MQCVVQKHQTTHVRDAMPSTAPLNATEIIHLCVHKNFKSKRCALQYAAMGLFRDESASSCCICSEGVKEALSSVVAEYDEQHKMREILVRLHRELLEDDEAVEVESVSGEFVQGVSWVRAMQFAEVRFCSKLEQRVAALCLDNMYSKLLLVIE